MRGDLRDTGLTREDARHCGKNRLTRACVGNGCKMMVMYEAIVVPACLFGSEALMMEM